MRPARGIRRRDRVTTRHDSRDRIRRDRLRWPTAIDDGVSTFRTIHVLRRALLNAIAAAAAKGRDVQERPMAILLATAVADGDGQQVVDVVRADYQDDGAWLVELRVAPR